MALAQQEVFNSFHGDNSLHNQTSEVLGFLESLPSQIRAVAHLLWNGSGVESQRTAISKLSLDNPLSKALLERGVAQYWNNMLHPPLSYQGDQFKYRSANGAENNVMHPRLGKAGSPYAKTVPTNANIYGARPDPSDLFDMLLARKDDRESKSGMSSMLLYHATIITHDIFRSSPGNQNVSNTSSYLDLSPLYGHDQDTQDMVRTRKLGLLKPDSFAEERLLMHPPGVCIYLVMYNRFHNYVARQLLEIDENGRFALPVPVGSKGWKELPAEQQQAMRDRQDEDLFQTARLITCGLYVNISIHDYLKCLLGLHEKNTAWTLDPRNEIPGKDKTGIPRGTGNQVSVEFNLLYRFHSPISARDRKWSEDVFKLFLGRMKDDDGQPRFNEDQILAGDIPLSVFRKLFDGRTSIAKEKTLPFLPKGLGPTAHGYKFERNALGMFSDAELVEEMCKVIEDPICQFGAQNVPKIFKAIEILGVLQARKWEVATLNEFRKFFGLKRHETFADINQDPEIASALRDLYEHPDCVELYPGIFAEGTGRCLDPGTLGPNNNGTALWSGVFCDAVTLARSDRFYTIDWSVNSLTAWGMHEVTSDPEILKGSVFYRLFQRAFPRHFRYNSIHLWQPFYTPAMNIVLAEQQGYLARLDLSDLRFSRELGLPDPDMPSFRAALAKRNYQELKGRTYRGPITEDSTGAPSERDPSIEISDFSEVKKKLLDKSKSGFSLSAASDDDVSTEKLHGAWSIYESKRLDEAKAVFERLVTPHIEQMFSEYLTGMSEEILRRQRRKFPQRPLHTLSFSNAREELRHLKLSNELLQKELRRLDEVESKFRHETTMGKRTFDEFSESLKASLTDILQVYQVDIVRDYAIPVITRFIADLLGFWDCIKTPHHATRKYYENQIYQSICVLQDSQSQSSNETTYWKRRDTWGKSLSFLKGKAEYGVRRSQGRFFGWVSRELKSDGDLDYVVKMREFGVELIKGLREISQSTEEVAMMMLAIALDATQNSVKIFTELLASFIDKPDLSPWIEIQRLAYENTAAANEEIRRRIFRGRCLPDNHLSTPANASRESIRSSFPYVDPLDLDPQDRKLHDRIYGHNQPSRFDIKDLSHIAFTAMLKHLATTRNLRAAPGKLGHLKRVKDPYGVEHYMTVKWDQLVSSPTTWNLRFDGYGRGVYRGCDNED